MEYNRVKRGLELGAVITAIVFSSIMGIIAVVDFLQILDVLKHVYLYEKIGYILGYGIMSAIFLTEAFVSIPLLFAPIWIRLDYISGEGKFEDKRKLRIAFIVVSSIISLLFLIASFFETSSIFFVFVFIAIVVLESVAFGMKDETERKRIFTNKNSSVEAKVAELKHLLELGVITQEQYERAINKVIKEIV
ncbi:MAG: hypothetical protein E7372_04890 [Clostridiales bacterium]|nr:hypothetical protein [Clostridiales bacterium]